MPPPGKIRTRIGRRNFYCRARPLLPVWEDPMPQQAKTSALLAPTIQQALTLHRQGRLAEAERLYRAAPAKQPQPFDGLHFLGVLRLQQGDAAEALELLRAATTARPGAAEVLPNLGAALAALGRYEEALSIYDGILHARPDDVDARYN